MVFKKLKEILAAQLDTDQEAITMETRILDDLGADSLEIITMLMSIEDEFDVEIPDDDIESLKTVGDVVEYIKDKIGE